MTGPFVFTGLGLRGKKDSEYMKSALLAPYWLQLHCSPNPFLEGLPLFLSWHKKGPRDSKEEEPKEPPLK